jgi:hypothetical protein
MSFLRPELKAAVWRWRETLAGIVTGLFGLWGALSSDGTAQMLGLAFAVAGAVLTIAGVQRARFRTGAGGPGLVQVDEGQVTYFGPFDGGTVAIRDLVRVELDPARPPRWLLTESGQPPLAIPTNAEGAEALFDVFATLDGIRTERMLAELKRRPTTRVVIWQSPKAQLAGVH